MIHHQMVGFDRAGPAAGADRAHRRARAYGISTPGGGGGHLADALFQFQAIDGHRVAAPDPDAADRYELMMNCAEELLQIQRELERQRFGFSTT